jgi:hypothetical protein
MRHGKHNESVEKAIIRIKMCLNSDSYRQQIAQNGLFLQVQRRREGRVFSDPLDGVVGIIVSGFAPSSRRAG